MQAWIGWLREELTSEPGVQMALDGQLTEAVRSLSQSLERQDADAAARARAGAALMRAYLLLGREQDVEELQAQLSVLHVRASRKNARWLIALDAAAVHQHLRHSGRVIELLMPFLVGEAPEACKDEALLMMAFAYADLGDLDCACALLARCRIRGEDPRRTQSLALFMESALMMDGGRISAERPVLELPDTTHLPRLLHPVLALWESVSQPSQRPAALVSALQTFLAWCQRGRIDVWADQARVLVATQLLGCREAALGEQVLGPLKPAMQATGGHRLALNLMWCKALWLAAHNRHADAATAFQQYAKEMEWRLRREYRHVPRLPASYTRDAGIDNAFCGCLPPRYRRVLAYVAGHLDDPQLSVAQMAAHINVTERALQQTFRRCLGMSPSELLRHLRVNGVAEGLNGAMPGESTRAVASHWGLGNRDRLRASARKELGADLPQVVE